MKKEILGILREKKFSPNHVENDAMIMKMTADKLANHGFGVKLVYESTFNSAVYDYPYYFSMGRNNNTLKKLQALTEKGALVINSSEGVYNSFRETMTPILQAENIAIPKSIVIDTENFDSSLFDEIQGRKIWLKRENHSLHREDVTPIYSKAECESTIREFKRRGIRKALLQEHKIGTEIKFYGLKDTNYFYWYYVNGEPHHKFEESDLKNITCKMSELLSLDVYGGDAIISSTGEISIIDFNDWPSFAPIRETASVEIANLISDRINGVS